MTMTTTTTKKNERYEEARAVLENGLEDIEQDQMALERYLRFRAHFRSYSPRNTLMILMQRPTAKYCMGYRQWQKHGRQVQKGERGLMIWIPLLRKPNDDEIEDGKDPDEKILYGWRVGYVFDYEQTKAVEPDALTYESPIPELQGAEHAHLYTELLLVADALGISVEVKAMTKEGYFHPGRHVIGIRRSMTPASKAATLAHELAHAVAHEEADGLSRAEMELQAEGAAYLALYALGLDTSKATLPYLKHYAEDDEALWAQLKAINRIAEELLSRVESVRQERSDRPSCEETLQVREAPAFWNGADKSHDDEAQPHDARRGVYTEGECTEVELLREHHRRFLTGYRFTQDTALVLDTAGLWVPREEATQVVTDEEPCGIGPHDVQWQTCHDWMLL